jgi:hypothetical protein
LLPVYDAGVLSEVAIEACFRLRCHLDVINDAILLATLGSSKWNYYLDVIHPSEAMSGSAGGGQ